MSSPIRLLIQKLFWASDEGSKIACASLPGHYISMTFKFGEYVGGCSFSIIYGQFSGIVERHVHCAQSPMHLAESASAVGCNEPLEVEIKKKQLQ